MTDEEFWKFVDENANADTTRLRLKHRGNPDIFEAIEQIDLQRKSADKFSNSPRRRLHTRLAVEQSTSDNIARLHASLAGDARSILDMTMGLGTDALAFAAIPGATVTAIEQNPQLAATSRINYASITNLQIIEADSTQWLHSTTRNFDLIYIDPARRSDSGDRVYNLHDCTPDVLSLLPLIFTHAPRLMVKCSPMIDITATIRELNHCSAIFIIESAGECRELLAIADSSTDLRPEDVPVTAISTVGDSFTFTTAQERDAQGIYGNPQAGQYLYEPSAAIMKCAPFKLLCDRYNLTALSPNSHVYFSPTLLPGFPGRVREIVAVEPYTSGNLKRFKAKWGNASVAVRNFIQPAEKLRSQLRVKDSDQLRVVATTTATSAPILILARPIS